jgi:hypothetical protein
LTRLLQEELTLRPIVTKISADMLLGRFRLPPREQIHSRCRLVQIRETFSKNAEKQRVTFSFRGLQKVSSPGYAHLNRGAY